MSHHHGIQSNMLIIQSSHYGIQCSNETIIVSKDACSYSYAWTYLTSIHHVDIPFCSNLYPSPPSPMTRNQIATKMISDMCGAQ